MDEVMNAAREASVDRLVLASSNHAHAHAHAHAFASRSRLVTVGWGPPGLL